MSIPHYRRLEGPTKRKGIHASAPERTHLLLGSDRTLAFPLEKTIAVARAIKEKNGGNPWPASEVANALGVSPKALIRLLPTFL